MCRPTRDGPFLFGSVYPLLWLQTCIYHLLILISVFFCISLSLSLSPSLSFSFFLTLSFSGFLSLSLSPRLTAARDTTRRLRSRIRTRPEGRSPSSLALFYFPKPTRFSMSTTRALLPRPAASYAPRVVVVAAAVGRFSSCTSRPRHWEAPTRVADGIERRESRRRRRRRRRTCGRVGVALASLR